MIIVLLLGREKVQGREASGGYDFYQDKEGFFLQEDVQKKHEPNPIKELEPPLQLRQVLLLSLIHI